MNARDISRYWWLQDIIRYLHISPVGLKTVATATAGHDMSSLQDPTYPFSIQSLGFLESQVSIGPSNSVPDLGSHEVPATCWGGMSFGSSHLEFTYVHLILNGKLQIRLPNLVWMCFCMSLHCDNTYPIGSMYGIYANKNGVYWWYMLPYIAATWILWVWIFPCPVSWDQYMTNTWDILLLRHAKRHDNRTTGQREKLGYFLGCNQLGKIETCSPDDVPMFHHGFRVLTVLCCFGGCYRCWQN